MEGPSTSKMHAANASDEEMEAEQSSTVPRKRNYPEDSDDDSMSDGSSDEYEEYFRVMRRASGRRYLVGVVEIPNAHYGKKMKLNCGHSRNNPDFYDDESSNSSCSSYSSLSDEIYVEPRYVAPNSVNYPNIHEPDDEPGPMSYNNADHILHGYWIIFSNVQGGWPYPIVKIFLQRHLKVDAIRGKPWPGTEPGPDDFRLIVSFSSREERDIILEELLNTFGGTNFSFIKQIGCRLEAMILTGMPKTNSGIALKCFVKAKDYTYPISLRNVVFGPCFFGHIDRPCTDGVISFFE